MEHVLILTVLAKERYVLTQVHILEVIGDKTAVAALYTLSKLLDYLLG